MDGMTYAVIDVTGKVTNVVVWDGKTEWQPPSGCSSKPYDPEVHKFEPPPLPADPTIAQRKADAAVALNNPSVLEDQEQRDAFARLIGVKPLTIPAGKAATADDIELA